MLIGLNEAHLVHYQSVVWFVTFVESTYKDIEVLYCFFLQLSYCTRSLTLIALTAHYKILHNN